MNIQTIRFACKSALAYFLETGQLAQTSAKNMGLDPTVSQSAVIWNETAGHWEVPFYYSGNLDRPAKLHLFFYKDRDEAYQAHQALNPNFHNLAGGQNNG